jgi:uncharacterized protein (TIGR00730 family)
MKLHSLCVFCGSSSGIGPEYLAEASSFGTLLASEGITLVYGGGNVGLMGALADAALAAGGKVIGVIPLLLLEKEVAHMGLTELHPVASMHERKMKMALLSNAFVALPGGIGTLDEIFEATTWTQLGFHAKPCGFLNVAGFYDPLFDFIRQLVTEGFLNEKHLDSLLIESDPRRLLKRLSAYQLSSKWS